MFLLSDFKGFGKGETLNLKADFCKFFLHNLIDTEKYIILSCYTETTCKLEISHEQTVAPA